MKDIDIYTTYKVIEKIKDTYKSYDSDADDWFKTDYYMNEFELDGLTLINKIIEKMEYDFMSITFDVDNNTFKIKVETFNHNDGTGCDYEYYIQKSDNTEKKEILNIKGHIRKDKILDIIK
jgi:hypothetical protein